MIKGVKLLRAMGWKEGQGIGPRVHRKMEGEGWTFTSIKHFCNHYWKLNTNLNVDEEDVNEFAKKVKFAPLDIELSELRTKKDRHGVGFDAFKHAPELAGFLIFLLFDSLFFFFFFFFLKKNVSKQAKLKTYASQKQV